MDYYMLQYEVEKERRERYMNEADQERQARQVRSYKPNVFSQVLSRRSEKPTTL
ncbi:MAG TPA: hypothetical protein PKX07_10845 [Aggregatilineales bacterium]|jgi:hypothetical protein|nr:hypothetical protein [Aggregatilineales bacterium]